MIGVRVKEYAADTDVKRAKLMEITFDAIAQRDFDPQIKMLFRQTNDEFIVMAIEPVTTGWNWPATFDEFKRDDRLFASSL
jgi:hypothetical protein